jgi:hypothetical protein
MFLLEPDSKPPTPTQNWLQYLAGFGLALAIFDYGASYLKSYILPPRIKLPYPLREWAAEDEFYQQDEQYITVYFDPTGLAQKTLVPSNQFSEERPDLDPIVGKWTSGKDIGH